MTKTEPLSDALANQNPIAYLYGYWTPDRIAESFGVEADDDRPLLREPDGECWDTGPETVQEPNYRALLTGLLESWEAFTARCGGEYGDNIVYPTGAVHDLQHDIERVMFEMARVNP